MRRREFIVLVSGTAVGWPRGARAQQVVHVARIGFLGLGSAGLHSRAKYKQAYLGHKNIQHTVRYTELSPTRFKDFWR